MITTADKEIGSRIKGQRTRSKDKNFHALPPPAGDKKTD